MLDILDRKDGLFSPADHLLETLQSAHGCYAFEKHLAGLHSPYQLLPDGSWTSGNVAAQHGFDLRLFYQVRLPACILAGAEQFCLLWPRISLYCKVSAYQWKVAAGDRETRSATRIIPQLEQKAHFLALYLFLLR